MADVSVPRIYSCYNCRNHVARHDDIISKNFQVMRATLWSSLIHSSFSDHFSWNFRCLMFTRQFFFCSESVSEKEDESVLIYALDCFTYCNNHFSQTLSSSLLLPQHFPINLISWKSFSRDFPQHSPPIKNPVSTILKIFCPFLWCFPMNWIVSRNFCRPWLLLWCFPNISL